MKKRKYRCLICDWEGNNPIEVEVMEPGEEGVYKVCPICFHKDLPTSALILNLEIYTYDE